MRTRKSSIRRAGKRQSRIFASCHSRRHEFSAGFAAKPLQTTAGDGWSRSVIVIADAASALCNACFLASGNRIRSLPLKNPRSEQRISKANSRDRRPSQPGGPDMNLIRIVTAAALGFPLVGPASAAGLADAPPGALSCSGCHPSARSADATVPRLISRNPADIIAAMQAFKSGQLPSTVMDRIAKGFSEDEVKAIAAWYGAQKD
jgi:cytochrome c553